jgi:hypothetical protein
MPRRHPSRDRRGQRHAPGPDRAVENVEQRLAAEQRRRETCARKDRFESEGEARSFAIMHSPGRGPRRQPYRCEVCDGWHLTSRPTPP